MEELSDTVTSYNAFNVIALWLSPNRFYFDYNKSYLQKGNALMYCMIIVIIQEKSYFK